MKTEKKNERENTRGSEKLQRGFRNWIRGKTQNKVMNEKNDWDTEEGGEHKIQWWIIRKTEKYEQGEEHKIKWWMKRKTEKYKRGEKHKIMWSMMRKTEKLKNGNYSK